MPIAKPIAELNFSLDVKREIALGTIINSVHQPSKKIFTFTISSAESAQITPAAINMMPQSMDLFFFIFLLLSENNNIFTLL